VKVLRRGEKKHWKIKRPAVEKLVDKKKGKVQEESREKQKRGWKRAGRRVNEERGSMDLRPPVDSK